MNKICQNCKWKQERGNGESSLCKCVLTEKLMYRNEACEYFEPLAPETSTTVPPVNDEKLEEINKKLDKILLMLYMMK